MIVPAVAPNGGKEPEGDNEVQQGEGDDGHGTRLGDTKAMKKNKKQDGDGQEDGQVEQSVRSQAVDALRVMFKLKKASASALWNFRSEPLYF